MEKTDSNFAPGSDQQAKMTCDHDFGDDGQSPVCLHCNTDRDTAEQMGRALFKAAVHQRHQAGGQ